MNFTLAELSYHGTYILKVHFEINLPSAVKFLKYPRPKNLSD